MLFLFFKTQLKEIKPLWCIQLHVHNYDAHSKINQLGILHCCKKKTKKKNQLHVHVYMYVQKEYNYHYYIVGINCDGNLYSPVIVSIKKVYNKEGWIVAN